LRGETDGKQPLVFHHQFLQRIQLALHFLNLQHGAGLQPVRVNYLPQGLPAPWAVRPCRQKFPADSDSYWNRRKQLKNSFSLFLPTLPKPSLRIPAFRSAQG
jgi:hypothetical protein